MQRNIMKNKIAIGDNNSNINITQIIINNYTKLINSQKSTPANTAGNEAAAVIIFSILIIGASSAYWDKLEKFTNLLIIASSSLVIASFILLPLKRRVYKNLRNVDGASGPVIKYAIVIIIQIFNLLYLFLSVAKPTLWPFNRSLGFSFVTAQPGAIATGNNPLINFFTNSLESFRLLIEQHGIYAFLPCFLFIFSLALCLASTLTIDIYAIGFILAGFLDKTSYSNATLGKLVNSSIKITIYKIFRISLMTIMAVTLEVYLINAVYKWLLPA